jgi:hypothetical protein
VCTSSLRCLLQAGHANRLHISSLLRQSFFISILGFVVPTTIMLIYVDVITTTKLKGQSILFLNNALLTASVVAQEYVHPSLS